MKNSIYILIISTFALASCSLVDLEPVGVGKENYVEFIPRPANFRGYDVTEVPTKAVYTDEQLTTLESKVHTAYFMIFKPNGQRHTFEALTVTDYNSIASYRIRTDVNNSDVTVCFLANVPYSYALSLDTKAKFLSTPLPLEYTTYSETGHIGIPKLKLDLNGDKIDDAAYTPCFPMCGIYEGPLGASAQQTILLNRLFAKVTVNLSMNMGTNLLEGVLGGALDDFFGDLFGDITIGNTAENARFEMSSYTLNNIPNQVLMVPAKKEVENSTPIITESPWVENTAKFEDPEEFEVETTIYDKSHPRADQPGYPTTFGFTFYTPEYALLPEASAVSEHTGKENRERFKPLLYDQDKKPIHMTLEGRLHDHGGSYANVKYKIYFGENNFDSFSLFRNNLYNNNLEIKNTGHLETGSTIDNRVEILPLNLVEAYGQAANCYIISIPGTYELDAYKGVVKPTDLASSTKFTGKPYTVWNTTESTNVITYPDEVTSQDKIVFTVSNSSGAIAPGNAVIAIRDANNNILWSWHLWFCEPDSRPDNTDYQHTYPESNAKMMNRALGATNDGESSTILDILKSLGYDFATWQDGLYYQWGRKDPLGYSSTVTTSAGDSYTNATSNPTTFYTEWTGTDGSAGWSSSKSANDPCPPGYMVPSKNVWRSNNPDATFSIGWESISYKTTNTDQYTFNLSRTIDPNEPSTFIFFPYGGNYDEDGNKQIHISEPLNITTKEGFTVGYSTDLTAYEILADMDVVSLMTPKEFRNIVLEFDHNIEHGAFWANDKNSLTYGYSTVSTASGGLLGTLLNGGYRIVSCEYRTGKAHYDVEVRKETVLWWQVDVTYHVYDGTIDWNNNWTTLSGDDLNSTNWTLEKAAINLELYDYLEENGVEGDFYTYDIDTSNPTANGLQIRCVMETEEE